MPLPEIQAALSSLKTALDIGSILIKADDALDKAYLKLEVEKMIDALVETKQTVRELDDKIHDQNKQIEILNEKLRTKETTVGFLGARYYINDCGEPTGSPFCPTCWATNHELIPLLPWDPNEFTTKCGKCKNTVESRNSPLDVDSYINNNKELGKKHGKEYVIKTTK